jgi:phospholipase/carboxylesterase
MIPVVTPTLDLLPHAHRPAAGAPAGALVLLHGRGTSEQDLVPLFDVLDPERRMVGLAPRGPLSLAPGGAHWYVVPRVGFPDRDTFLATVERLSAWLDAVPAATRVPWERTVLGGFSQGGVMSLALGLGPGRASPAGIIALSGFIPTVEGWDADLEAHRDVPVAIGHGTQDPIIGVELGRAARDRLLRAGLDVLYREGPFGHTIDPGFVPELQEWLAARAAGQ